MTAELRRLAHWVYVAARPRDDTAPLFRIAAALPVGTRRVVTLRKVYDLAVPEIAARLGLTTCAVEHHLVTAALAFGGCTAASAARGHTDSAGARPSAADTDSIDCSESHAPCPPTSALHQEGP